MVAGDKGSDDMPASGITFDRARAYCDWLSKKTGKTFRLPSEAEADTLYDKSEPGENTLDYWAGYAVNPDDARGLRQKIKELAGTAPLLRAVGRFRGTGEGEQVFDLGGNVAEWTTGKDGAGVLRGGRRGCASQSPAARKPGGAGISGVTGSLGPRQERLVYHVISRLTPRVPQQHEPRMARITRIKTNMLSIAVVGFRGFRPLPLS